MILNETIDIEGEKLGFSKWWLLDEQISIMLPEGFYGVSKREIDKEYSGFQEDEKPDILLYDHLLSAGLLFKIVNYPIDEQAVEQTVKLYMRTKLYEGVSQMLVNGMLNGKSGDQIGFFDFINRFVPPRHELAAYLCFKGQLLYVNCTFPYMEDEIVKQRQIFRCIMKSYQREDV